MGAVILVHGGAGSWGDADRLRAGVDGCLAAAQHGADRLEEGALEAVVAAVRVLEQNESFNAGLGSTLTSAGTIELDAALMTGDLKFGAIAACPPMGSAIEAARAVHEWGEHSVLSGEAALHFAISKGIKPLGPDDLKVDRVVDLWERERQRRLAGNPSTGSGTVGAVAVDAGGNLAAATSTGGILFKRPGRIGDTPLPGAGTYADVELGAAASATGHGESILRVLLCRIVAEEIGRGEASQAAADSGIRAMQRRVGGKGGLIVVDRSGSIGTARNTESMPWAACRPQQSPKGGS